MKVFRFLHVCLVGILMVGLLAATPPTPVRAATLTVNTLSDVTDGDCGDGSCSLRDAIAVANINDTITFSVTGTITLTGGVLDIGKDLTITGPDPENAGALVIDANNASRVMQISISSLTVAISNLTLQNGNAIGAAFNPGNGGGLAASTNTLLTLDNVIIQGNTAGTSGFAFGGGLYAGGGTSVLTITNSEIRENTSNFGAGGLFFGSGTINIQNTQFIDNEALGSSGGGIGGGLSVEGATLFIMHESLVSGNSAKTGGGMYVNGVTTANVTSSLVQNNTAQFGIGGVYLNGSAGQTVNITNTTISGNSATDASAMGGGIAADSSSDQFVVNLVHSTVHLNTSGGAGGGLRVFSSSTINLKNSILAGNTSTNSTEEDCSGAVVSQDYNLIQVTDGCTLSGTTTNNITNTSPMLDALADNGGATDTHAPQTGSPAVDAIPSSVNGCGTLHTVDQRGASRPLDGDEDSTAACDIGAHEVPQPASVVITADSPDPSLVGKSVRVTAVVSSSADPGGTVSITGADTNCNITLSGGSSSCNVVFNSAGGKLLTAVYNGDLNHNAGAQDTENHSVSESLTFKSQAANDGWVRESAETSSAGGTPNNSATILNVGDDATNRQYRAILSFNTAGLPDDAVITKIKLKVRQQGIVGGGNPVNTFKGFFVDIKQGNFGNAALQLTDFNASPSSTLGPFKPVLTNGWYVITLTAGSVQINLTGNTQIRLRFKLDDNNNLTANFLKLFSGDAPSASRPQLIVEYQDP